MGRPAKPVRGGKVSDKVVGVDVDKAGVPLVPTRHVIYWRGSGEQILPCPGQLCDQNLNKTWQISYMQRTMPSFSMFCHYSDKPSAGCWTFPEAYIDWNNERLARR